jgi:glycosyltransferase involved in cell wall biosynthesis
MDCLVVTPHRLGIREVAERIGQEWEAMGHDVEYLLAKGEAARIGPVTVGAPGIAVWWYRTLRRIARNHGQYDLVWTHQPIAPALPTDDPTFWRKVVVTFHTTFQRKHALAREGVYPQTVRPLYWVVRQLESRFHRSLVERDVDGPHYTVVSPHLRDEIDPYGVTDTRYIPNGIFGPESSTFAPIRHEAGVPEDATLVFNIGSLTPQKRADTFARVMRESLDTLENTHCVVAGDGPLRDAVEQHTSDRLHAVGYVSDEAKWRWFADADVFASLSAYEGMPVATTEALSFGLPVVLSDIPAHRHLVRKYDATRQLVGDDPVEVATAISELAGSESIVALPEWRDVAEQYLGIVA